MRDALHATVTCGRHSVPALITADKIWQAAENDVGIQHDGFVIDDAQLEENGVLHAFLFSLAIDAEAEDGVADIEFTLEIGGHTAPVTLDGVMSYGRLTHYTTSIDSDEAVALITRAFNED